MYEIKLREEYIKLGQALKAVGLVESGVEAKDVIVNGVVKVNGAVEVQRGKKLYDGDIVSFDGEQIKIVIKSLAKLQNVDFLFACSGYIDCARSRFIFFCF